MKPILLCTFLLFPFAIHAQDTENLVQSEIKTVTVFQRGAEVTREASVVVPAGTTSLRFVGITPDLDTQSIQLRADGDLTVLSVVHRNNFFEDTEHSEESELLLARKEEKQDSLRREQMMLQVYQHEEDMLVVNKAIGGSASGVQIAELEAAAAFFRERLTDIKSKQLDINNSIEKLRKEIETIDNQLNELNANRRDQYTSEITVTTSAETRVQGAFTLSYLTTSSGWFPHYDIRVRDIDSPIALTYNTNVHQASGEDWNDVRLTLSTGDPGQSGTKPELYPWRIGFFEPREDEKAVELDAFAVVAEASAETRASRSLAVQQYFNTTTVSYEIALPYTIPSDGKPNAVKIQEYEVPASYQYYCAPKIDDDAFLTARITGWEEYALQSGEANLFFEGTFMGNTFLDTQSVSDTLVVSLGRDRNIVVDRTKLVEFSQRRFLRNRMTETYAFEIEVRNNKNLPIQILLEDQIPVSTDSRIEVQADSYESAELDEETGILRWLLDLPPAAQETLRFQYSVRYPRGQTVILE